MSGSGEAIDRAREMGLTVERDPNDLERYPEATDDAARFYRIILRSDGDDLPPRQYIDARVTPVGARYFLYGIFETAREQTNERTVRGWLTRYGVPR